MFISVVILITSFQMKWALLKWSNGYLPWNHNHTVDVCRFLRRSKHLLNNFVYGMFRDYSNLNHTCPYNHDVIIHNLPKRFTRRFDLLLLPHGDYAIEASWYTDDVLRSEARLYFSYF
ncbi:hypothetical protein KR093_000325 [Drosophila rubida]|uniref:Uncharacterized protein n=1 Tax=Drosophila rubida TaxID=30044 RepID=A0AAD4JYI8_9MUSC|nr:hypothetical protein KR093_000325 [Drosophila rubida]